jgi:hypothetical protein
MISLILVNGIYWHFSTMIMGTKYRLELLMDSASYRFRKIKIRILNVLCLLQKNKG